MSLNWIRIIAAIIFFSASCQFSFSQQIPVWPGDANDDGIVNNLDLLNVGLGFGIQGNARDYISTVWQQQQVDRKSVV